MLFGKKWGKGLTRKQLVPVVSLLFVVIMLVFGQAEVASAQARTLMAICLQVLCLALASYVLVRLARGWIEALGLSREKRQRVALLTAVCSAVCVVLFFLFFESERDIKIYDSALYWKRLVADRAMMEDSILGYLISLRDTLATEYNHLFVLPLMPVTYLAGIDFAGFSIALLLVYYLPASFFLTLFALRVNQKISSRQPGVPAFMLCFALCVLNAAALWPVMNGYMDVAGALWMALLLNVTLDWDMFAWNWKQNMGIAVLGVLMLLSRGHFEFYLIGFFAAFFVVALVQAISIGAFRWKKLGVALLNLAVVAGIGALLLLCLNPASLRLFIQRDYAALYSAYKTMSLIENLWIFAKHVGILWLVMAFFGAIVLLRGEKTRALCLRVMLTSIIATVMLCATQDMQVRHYYLMLPALLMLVCAFAEFAMQYAQSQEKPIFVLCALLVCVASFGLAYVPPLEPYSYMSEPLTPTLHRYPVHNPYFSIAKHVAADIGKLVGDASQYVYMVGDGPLNNEMLENAFLPERENAAPYLLPVNNADIRDGFPSQAFLAEYILVNRPYQSDFLTVQQVNFQLYDLIVNDPFTEEYYTLEETYEAEGKTFELYQKKRPTDKAVVDALKRRLQAYHPDNDFVCEPNYFLALFNPEDGLRYMYNYWIQTFTFTKTDAEAVRFGLTDTAEFTSLDFMLSCDLEGLTLVVEDQTGVIERAPVVSGKQEHYSFDITDSETIEVSIVDASSQKTVEAEIRLSFSKESLR